MAVSGKEVRSFVNKGNLMRQKNQLSGRSQNLVKGVSNTVHVQDFRVGIGSRDVKVCLWTILH